MCGNDSVQLCRENATAALLIGRPDLAKAFLLTAKCIQNVEESKSVPYMLSFGRAMVESMWVTVVYCSCGPIDVTPESIPSCPPVV